MTTTRCFHAALALVAALSMAAPGAASAKPKRIKPPDFTIHAGSTNDPGSASDGECQHYAELINQENAIIQGSNDWNLINQAMHDKETLIHGAESAGCFLYSSYGDNADIWI